MNLENGKISSFQLACLLIGYTLGVALFLTPGGMAKQDAWIAVLLGLGEGLILAFCYVKLSVRFKGKTLVQIGVLVYGPYLGKLVSMAYLWFLFHLASLIITDIGMFFTTMIMPETPLLAIQIMIMAASVLAARKGIEAIARCSEILVPLMMLMLFIISVFLLNQFDIRNLLPILEVPPGTLLWTAHRTAVFPFGETVAFLMVMPFLNNAQKGPRVIGTSLLLAGLILSFISFRNTGVLGALGGIVVYPTFEAVRQVDLFEIISRLEIIPAIFFLFVVFIEISTLLHGIALGTAQIFRLRSYLPLIVPLAILMVIPLNYESIADALKFADEIYPIYALPFELGIPLVTLLLAMIRRLPKEGGKA